MAYESLRKYALLCGVKDHETLRGTELRKQLATMMYGLQISETHLKQLTNFLGHDYENHKSYYRQRIPVQELITMTPMLQQAQGAQAQTTSEINGNDKSLESQNGSLYVPSTNEG